VRSSGDWALRGKPLSLNPRYVVKKTTRDFGKRKCNYELHIHGRVLEDVGPMRSKDFSFGRRQKLKLDAFDTVQIRLDPPTDLSYQQTIQMLRFGAVRQTASKTEFVNPIPALLESTSKLEPLILSGHSPTTLVSRDWNALYGFGRKERFAVLKPLNSFQRLGVEELEWETSKGRALARRRLMEVTNGFTEAAVLQRVLPRHKVQEVRIWFLDGSRPTPTKATVSKTIFEPSLPLSRKDPTIRYSSSFSADITA
jgi:hypothetical protein